MLALFVLAAAVEITGSDVHAKLTPLGDWFSASFQHSVLCFRLDAPNNSLHKKHTLTR